MFPSLPRWRPVAASARRNLPRAQRGLQDAAKRVSGHFGNGEGLAAARKGEKVGGGGAFLPGQTVIANQVQCPDFLSPSRRTPQGGLFTAAQLARALAVAPQAVRARLADRGPDGELVASGNAARAWRVASLPRSLVADLTDAWQRAEGPTLAQPWRGLEHFISDPPPVVSTARGRNSLLTSAPTEMKVKGWKAGELDGLDGLAGGLSDGLTPGEVANFWHRCFEVLEEASAGGRAGLARGLRHWLGQRVPALAMDKRSFNRKRAQWQAGGRTAAALCDRRAEANTARKLVRVFPAADMDLLVSCAAHCHLAAVAPAWDELMRLSPEQGGFSQATREQCAGPIPDGLRTEAGSRAKAQKDFVLQPRKAHNSSVYSDRAWHLVNAGDWYTADDFTLEVYFSVPDGQGWYKMTRGQVLLLIDERSRLILDFVLVPEGSFGAADYRALLRAVFLKYGVCRAGLKHENGPVFRSAKLVAGETPWGETETSLAARLGIKIEHAKPGNAKSKLPEGVGKQLQARLRRHPGWCGPNEMAYPIEETKRALIAVAARRETPSEAGFYTYEEWRSVLHGECDAYNGESQNSKVMGGRGVAVRMTPKEAWQTLTGKEPLVDLRGSGAEHLLTHHWRMVKVTRFGIRFQMGKEIFACSGAATGGALGQEVKFYFDPENADVAFFETADGKLHTVERQRLMPAHGASDDCWSHRGETVEAHRKALQRYVSNLPTDFLPPRRANVVSPETAQRGEAITAGRVKAAEKAQRRETGRQAARKLGLPAPANDRMARAMASLLDEDSEKGLE